MEIPMLHAKRAYEEIKEEVNEAVIKVLASGRYIGGLEVEKFTEEAANYLGVSYAIPCANGTDALQIALMALDLQKDDEVIIPAFTYAATAEVLCLLGLRPVMVDVDKKTFNISAEEIVKFIGPRTRAIIPVHLFGLACDMTEIMKIASQNNLYVIEDNAQSFGTVQHLSDGSHKQVGSFGDFSCTSFFPTKNLGAYGDGGMIFTNDSVFAKKAKMIASHGQVKRYYHEVIGCNSRLDAIQAAILRVKLKYLNEQIQMKQQIATYYLNEFTDLPEIRLPEKTAYSNHTYHQFTIQFTPELRDKANDVLQMRGVETHIYYPLPLYKQNAFKTFGPQSPLPVTELLCQTVLSIPINANLTMTEIETITNCIKGIVNN